MNLKPSEKAAILAGKHPQIVRPPDGACPFEKGEEIILKSTGTLKGKIPEVSIVIAGKHRHKNGAWEAVYTVKDDRGVYVNQGLGYTRSPVRALDPEAPVLDEEVIEEYAMEAAQATTLLRAEHKQKAIAERAESRASRGQDAEEYAARQRKRLEAAA
jgi:hypothetical protein